VKHSEILAIIVLTAIAFYLVVPKYELYQSGGDGTITYRFNKVTGKIEARSAGEKNWDESTPFLFIKKP